MQKTVLATLIIIASTIIISLTMLFGCAQTDSNIAGAPAETTNTTYTTTTTTTTTSTSSTTSTTVEPDQSSTSTTSSTTTTTTTTSTTTTTIAFRSGDWPGESWTDATNLTGLNGEFIDNMSGSTWNPETRIFWVSCNGGPSAFWTIVEDGSGDWEIGNQYNAAGDLEGITQADYSEDVVYLLNESSGLIVEYDVSVPGTATFVRQWNISAHIPAYGAGPLGPEGITFVPDEWLEHWGFRNSAGELYTSHNGMGGLILVAHQNGGRIYVFDLNRSDSTYDFVGAYRTRRAESAGLEFDRSNGYLYIWHNTGSNYLEITTLASYLNSGERYLTPIAEFTGPAGSSGNLEGIGIPPASGAENWCLMVDDGTNGSNGGVRLFTTFDPGF